MIVVKINDVCEDVYVQFIMQKNFKKKAGG